tara:strand:+ start:2154 stop:3344 length:1191 start_codon:yes stop_codon:yes gene_type:complete
MTDIKNLIEEQNRLWEEAKDVNEKNLAENRRFKSDFDEKWEKINNRLNDIDETVQNVKAAQRPSSGAVSSEIEEKSAEYEGLFYKYLQLGTRTPETHLEKMRSLQTQIHTKANILSLTDASGGYAVPKNIAEMIMKTVAEKSPIRQFSTVLTLSQGNSISIPRATVAAATWDNESTFPSSPWSPTVDQVTITPSNLNACVKVSRDALMDIPNINQIAVNALADAVAVKEGNAFAAGDGSASYGSITGLTSAAGLNNVAAGATSVTYDQLMTLAFGQTKPEYHPNARWCFNKSTLNDIRQLKTANNDYIWQPIVDGMGFGKLAEFPYFIAADLPDIATGKKSIFFGDFSKGFYVVDREGLVVDRLLEKDYPLVDIVLRKRVAGGVVVPEALGHITHA